MLFTIRIDPEMALRLDRAAARRGLTRSALVRDALDRALEEDAEGEERSFYDDISLLVGCVDSGGMALSEQTGARLRALLEKRRQRNTD